ncbi:phage portal protein, partial [Escherichia coli]|nr:phage portal protein [Escherichia coli]
MKWFGRKSARDGARPALSRGGNFTGGIGEWPRSYEAQVREAYCHNPVAQRAVKLVAEGAGSAGLNASDPALL